MTRSRIIPFDPRLARRRPQIPPDSPPRPDERLTGAILDHLRRTLGPVEGVAYSTEPDELPVAVLHVPPEPHRRRHILVTAGMAARPMHAPPEAPDCSYCELMLALPEEWPVGPGMAHDMRVGWPLFLLRDIARMPHLSKTWLWHGHTVRDPEPDAVYAVNTRLASVILDYPRSMPLGFDRLRVDAARDLTIFNLIPIYPEECAFAMSEGSEELLRLLTAERFGDVVDIHRRSVVRLDSD